VAQIPRAPFAPLAAGDQQLPKDLGGYLVRVLRLRAGDAFVLFDPDTALEADAELLRDVPAIARVGAPRAVARTSKRDVSLLQGLAKGDKPEQVVRAAVALGARSISFVRTERSVAGAELRTARLRAVMLDAARQCGRGDLPELGGLLDFADAAGSGAGLRLLLDPSGDESLVEVLRGAPPERAVTLAIGPEGGFSAEESAALQQAGFTPVRLSAYVLRTELAAVAALAVVAAHE
jgi:16S rRNA (uracil1498-N3)-methyltransferase